MLNAFSIDKTLKRNGRLPSWALNWFATLSPIKDGSALRYSESNWSVDATLEGDFGCVPIHNCSYNEVIRAYN